VTAKCPVDEKPDVYELTVRTGRTIKVEDILKAVAANTTAPVFQEDLTKALHRDLGCSVTTVGIHSDVTTTVECLAT
jgi:hypothetical protein